MNEPRGKEPEEQIPEEDSSRRLTTKDMATGVAAKRVRDEHGEGVRAAQTEQSSGEAASPLFESTETETFRSRWHSIQMQFVDEPRKSVEEADELLATAMKRLAEIFAAERENLEREWDRGDDVSTEDLRIALQRYRSFFDRLLSV